MGGDAPVLSLGTLLGLAGVAHHSRLVPLTESMLQLLLPCACSTPLQQVHGFHDCSAQSLWVLDSTVCHLMPSQAGGHKSAWLSQKHSVLLSPSGNHPSPSPQLWPKGCASSACAPRWELPCSVPSWELATSPGAERAQLPVGFGCPVGKRKGEQMSQSPSVAGAFHPLSHPCSLVPSPCGRSWCILNLVPLIRADVRVFPSTPCLSLVCPGCCWAALKGQQRPSLLLLISLLTHLLEQSSSFSPPVLPIQHSISPATLTTALWSPWLPLSNDLPFLLPSSLSSCLPLQNWGGFSSGLRRGATDKLGLRGLMLKEDLDRLVSRTQAGSWQLC